MSKTLRELTLATVTVTGDLYHVSGADLLDKRITIDDIATAVRVTLKGPLTANEDVTIQTGGLLKARSNEDVIQEIGRVKIFGIADTGYGSHFDNADASSYAWGQNNPGDTFLNAKSGRTISLRIANGNVTTITGTAISLLKETSITTQNTSFGLLVVTSEANGIRMGGATLSRAIIRPIIGGADKSDADIIYHDSETAWEIESTLMIGVTTWDTVSTLQVAGAISCTTIDTGNGVTDVYLMDQNLKTTNDVTFADMTLNGVLEFTLATPGITVHTTTGDRLLISGGVDATDGGNIILRGSTSISKNNHIELRQAGVVAVRVGNSGRVLLGADVIDNTIDFLQVGYNTAVSASIAKARISTVGDYNYLSHVTLTDTTEYALSWGVTGDTFLNAVTGQVIHLTNNTGDIATFADASVSIVKPTTIDVSTDFGFIVFGTDDNGISIGGVSSDRAIIRPYIAGVSQGDADIIYHDSETAWEIESTLMIGVSTWDTVSTLQVAGVISCTTINTGYGANEVVPEDVYYDTAIKGSSYNLPTLDVKQTGHIAVRATAGINIILPVTGNYSYWYLEVGGLAVSDDVRTAGTVIVAASLGDNFIVTWKRVS